MGHITFREYVERRDSQRESLDWGMIQQVPLWGWAAGAAALAALEAVRRIANRYANDKRELRQMSDWWFALDKLIERYGPDSEQVQQHMKYTEKVPYSYLKSMAESHLSHAREEAKKQKEAPDTQDSDLFNKYDNARKPARV